MQYDKLLAAVRNEISGLLSDLATAADQNTGQYLQGRIAFLTDVAPIEDLKKALNQVAKELKGDE